MKIKTLLFASLLLALMAGNAKAQDNELFNQGFDDPNYLKGWTFNGIQIQIGELVPYGAIDEVICNAGPNSFHFGNNMSDYGYLVSPELTDKDPRKGVSVSFFYTNYYKDCASEFKVGYSTTTADPNAFTWGEMVTASNGKYDLDLLEGDPDWKEYVNSFPADAKYIAIAKVIGGFHLFVDDIVLSETDCAMPSIPVASNVESDAITVEWTGTAQGLKCSSLQDFGFEDEVEELGDWTQSGGWNCWWSGEDASGHNSKYCVLSDVIESETDNYLVSPSMQLGGRVTFYAMGIEGGSSLKGHHRDGDYNLNFKVMVTTAEEPDVDDFVPVTDAEYEASIEGWVRYSVDLSAYSGQGHVAICHVYNENEGEKGVKDGEEEETYLLAIDDITLYTPVVNNHELTENENSYTIGNLHKMTKYAIQLKGCNLWTDALYVATLPEDGINSYEFVQDGYWSEFTNWKNWYMPQGDNDNIVISANARIPANYVAKAGPITISNNGYYGSITIADGGQLKHSTPGLVVTAEKDITAYPDPAEGKAGYYLIASPLVAATTAPTNVVNMTNNNYDLYRFNEAEESEWENWKKEGSDHYHFNLENGKGYLYANSSNVTLRFTGAIKPSNNDITVENLSYTGTAFWKGWNLVGNPFMCDANIDREDFYVLNEAGSEVEASTSAIIAPLQGVFVKATSDNESVTFSRATTRSLGSVLNVNVIRNEANVDVARVRFGEGQGLEKFQFNPSHTKVYFPQNGKNYAVVNANGIGELPCNFKAEEDGTYTLSFTKEQVEFNYLHLIDNMTGADIDLLQQPEYTFQAKNDDYASRFRVVFVAKDAEGIAEDSETFAFNSYGSWIIANEGLATLQMVDINGRMICNETIEGYTSMKFNVAPGVYVLRLVNGENVRVQKVVVR